MKKTLIVALMLALSPVHAALPPQYQNTEDLEVMTDYIRQNVEVISTLESIDFRSYTVYFNKGCKAVFGRKESMVPDAWKQPGPAEPLEFKRLTCDPETE